MKYDWLRGLWCRIVGHQWKKWREYSHDLFYATQVRRCRHCGRRQKRERNCYSDHERKTGDIFGKDYALMIAAEEAYIKARDAADDLRSAFATRITRLFSWCHK